MTSRPFVCPHTSRKSRARGRAIFVAVLLLVTLALISPRGRAEAELASVESTAGLVAHWKLDEGTGPSAADDVAGHTALLSANGAIWTGGRVGGGVELDGVQGYIAPPILDVPGSALTLAAWVKVADFSSGADQRFITKSTDTSEQAHYWMLSHVNRDGRNLLRFRLKTGSATTTLIASSGDLPAETWFHAAATYDGATMRLYLDGVEVGNAAKTGTIATNAVVPVDIGRSPDGSNHLHGVIDDVRIYNRALTAADIAAAIGESEESAPSSQGPAPLAHWSLDEGVGTTATDIVGGLPATLAGAASWASGRVGHAVQLDGTSGYLAGPSLDIPASGLTLAAWVHPFATGEYQRIISKATGTAEDAHYWMLSETPVSGARRLRFRLKTGTTTTTLIAASGDLPVNAWYHAAATYDGATMRLYLDGVEVGHASKTGSIATNGTVPMDIGRNPDGSFHLNGLVDEVRIYDRALTPADIAAIMAPANQPPTVELTSPTSGATFTAPAAIALAADASDPENHVSDVQFFAGTTLLGTATAPPYAFTWSSVPAGSYSLTAVVRDAEGASTASAAVGITVMPPSNLPPAVELTSPSAGATFTAPATITLTAAASDPENRLAEVQFFSGTTLLGTAATAPYTFTWTSVATGFYSIAALARDADGGSTVSTPVEIAVTAPADQPLAHWNFDEGVGTTATDVGGGLTATLEGGATWAAGRSGYAVKLNGSTAYVGVPGLDVASAGLTLAAWVNPFSAGEYQRIISKATDAADHAHYWMLSETPVEGRRRLRFRLKTGSTTTTLIAASGDLPVGTWYHAAATYDGATMRVYLNGVEVGRTSKSGTIATDAIVPVNIGRNPDGSYPLNGLVDDVRIYDRALSAAEITAVMEPTGEPTNQPPVVELTSPLAGATFTAPATITMTAAASDPENRLTDVQFFSGTTLLDTDATAPYSFTWSSVPVGSYVLTALARDADGASTASIPLEVTVTAVATWIVAFTASADHDSAVTSYVVDVFASGADPDTAIALATSDLGKPQPDATGEIYIDRTSFFEALAAGDYVITVSAVGLGGSTRSSPYLFSR